MVSSVMFGVVESMFVVQLLLLSKVVCFMCLGYGFCLVRSCSGWVGCWAFCLSCDAWSLDGLAVVGSQFRREGAGCWCLLCNQL